MEEQLEYRVNNDEWSMTKTFNIQVKHMGMIKALKEQGFGDNDSAIVRNAIEMYFVFCQKGLEAK